MSKLMWIAGILLAAAGVAAGAIVLLALAPVPGLTLETAAILLVGGILSLGLGSVIEQLRRQPVTLAKRSVEAAVEEAVEDEVEEAVEDEVEEAVEDEVQEAVEEAVEESVPPAPAPIPRFDPRTVKPSVELAADAAPLEVSQPTLETIEALEKARQQIAQAFAPKKSEPAAVTAAAQASELVMTSEPDLPTDVVEEFAEEFVEEFAEDQAVEAAQLYVVEERLIRDRAARILSDGTVEAETDEGWMRFENIEHLNEYFDAMEAART